MGKVKLFPSAECTSKQPRAFFVRALHLLIHIAQFGCCIHCTKRRSLSLSSKALQRFWRGWSQLPPLWCALRPQQHLSVEAAAEAMGNGDSPLADTFHFQQVNSGFLNSQSAILHLQTCLSSLRHIVKSAATSVLVRLD